MVEEIKPFHAISFYITVSEDRQIFIYANTIHPKIYGVKK